ncbi:hypothetical protein [Microscilla marina]|uniref:Uncharacterized protein n=1 Tax=Microscilla marina ATCC 23134 TaxID=313606 RepID=A1ZVE8_MICM2|nr:hypothetical protein [Microscilla marina]EAY25646.1 hypothetical protein M23134_07297 [Microscilla marina ATCC 23134]
MDNAIQIVEAQIEALQQHKAATSQEFKACVKAGKSNEADCCEIELSNVDRAVFELMKLKSKLVTAGAKGSE